MGERNKDSFPTLGEDSARQLAPVAVTTEFVYQLISRSPDIFLSLCNRRAFLFNVPRDPGQVSHNDRNGMGLGTPRFVDVFMLSSEEAYSVFIKDRSVCQVCPTILRPVHSWTWHTYFKATRPIGATILDNNNDRLFQSYGTIDDLAYGDGALLKCYKSTCDHCWNTTVNSNQPCAPCGCSFGSREIKQLAAFNRKFKDVPSVRKFSNIPVAPTQYSIDEARKHDDAGKVFMRMRANADYSPDNRLTTYQRSVNVSPVSAKKMKLERNRDNWIDKIKIASAKVPKTQIRIWSIETMSDHVMSLENAVDFVTST